MATIDEILELEFIERDIYRGPVFPSYLQRTFGGQVASQALAAAARTVDPYFSVHSLHGYFLRPGNPDKPTVYLVDRVRDGRSFVTRRVQAVQDGEDIFFMSASFHKQEKGFEHQDPMPTAPDPLTLDDAIAHVERGRESLAREWENVDLRIVPAEQITDFPGLAAQQRVWFRYRHRLPYDHVVHVCTLAYMSDMTLLSSSRVAHPGSNPQASSLDHAMWFLRPFRADEWLLYDQTSPSADGGRALTQGRIFDQQGNMVAAVVQEGLARFGRDMPTDQYARTTPIPEVLQDNTPSRRGEAGQ